MVAADKKRKVKLTGKIVAGGKLLTKGGLRYTFTGKDKQWATFHEDKVVTVDLILTLGGRGLSVKRRRPSLK